MNFGVISAVVSWFFTGISLIFAFTTVMRNKKTDDTAAARQLGQVMTQIGVLQGQIAELNAKLDRKDEQHLQLIERISKVEASANQFHKRFDNHLREG